MAGAQKAKARPVQVEIEYAIVALALTASDVAQIIAEATGVIVDTQANGFWGALDGRQLESVRTRLLQDPRWKKNSQPV